MGYTYDGNCNGEFTDVEFTVHPVFLRNRNYARSRFAFVRTLLAKTMNINENSVEIDIIVPKN